MHVVQFLPAGRALYSAAICKAIITKNGQSEEFDNLRTSIMVEQQGEDLKIAHMHASFPDTRSEAGYPFPRLK